MDELIPLFLKGATIGFSAGIAPGPLTLLVITRTIQSGLRDGIKVAAAPVLTDIPIVALCVVILDRAKDIPIILSGIAFAGGLALLKMALMHWRSSSLDINAPAKPGGALLAGVIANFLNPHPYLFWMTVGVPMILQSRTTGGYVASAGSFMCGMFLVMISTKLALALVAQSFRSTLQGPAYRLLNRLSAVALVFFAIAFAREGLRQLGVPL